MLGTAAVIGDDHAHPGGRPRLTDTAHEPGHVGRIAVAGDHHVDRSPVLAVPLTCPSQVLVAGVCPQAHAPLQRREPQRQGERSEHERAQAEVRVGEVDPPAEIAQGPLRASLEGIAWRTHVRSARSALRGSSGASGEKSAMPISDTLARIPAGSLSARDPRHRTGQACELVPSDAGQRTGAPQRREVLVRQPRAGAPECSPQASEEVPGIGRLAQAVDLEQPTPLVEAASQLLHGRVCVGVHHGCLWHERLGIAGPQHVHRQRPVLGVSELAVGHLLPGRPQYAPIGVGEEPPPAGELGRRHGKALVLVEALERRESAG